MSIILAIIILGIIIFLHELGHFMTAKYYKMPVLEFAIGMGPKLFTKRIGETDYSIRMLPLGGFVNIAGMQPEENPEDEVPGGFYTKPAFSRFVVLIAGVMMNFLTSIIAIFILISMTGVVPLKYIEPVIGTIQESSRAKDFLQPGDRITEINGAKISNWKDLQEEILKINGTEKKYNDEDISIKVFRNGKEMSNNVKLTYSKETESYILGIQVQSPKLSFLKKIKISVYSFAEYFKMMVHGLKMLITGKVSAKEITGPVGLPKFVGEAYKTGGGLALINIFIILSINIGLMNLLPIPALDGGRLLFVIPEFIGIKVNKKIEEKIHMVGMMLLLLLMAFIIFNDVTKYF